MGGRPLAWEFDSACSRLGSGRRRALVAWASKRDARRKFSILRRGSRDLKNSML